MSKVWLVTGSGRGLGRDIVKAALAAGDREVSHLGIKVTTSRVSALRYRDYGNIPGTKPVIPRRSRPSW